MTDLYPFMAWTPWHLKGNAHFSTSTQMVYCHQLFKRFIVCTSLEL